MSADIEALKKAVEGKSDLEVLDTGFNLDGIKKAMDGESENANKSEVEKGVDELRRIIDYVTQYRGQVDKLTDMNTFRNSDRKLYDVVRVIEGIEKKGYLDRAGYKELGDAITAADTQIRNDFQELGRKVDKVRAVVGDLSRVLPFPDRTD